MPEPTTPPRNMHFSASLSIVLSMLLLTPVTANARTIQLSASNQTKAATHMAANSSPTASSSGPTTASRKARSSSLSRPGLKQRKIAYRSRRKRSRPRRKRAYRAPKIGILVQSADGKIVCSEHCDEHFNPASAIKLLTAYGALKKFGANHRFVTALYLNGALQADTGLLTGDIYIDGRDPDFNSQDASALFKSLNDRGIKKVSGKLMVSPGLTFRHNGNPVASGQSLVKVWKFGDKDHRIIVSGPVAIGRASDKAELIYQHQSEPLKQTLKVMLSKSLNGCAERIGCVVGGLTSLEKLAVDEIGLTAGSIKLASSSGLGVNRMTPKEMMNVLIALEEELGNQGLSFQDIMPVAGIDQGTLKKRFDSEAERGSVIAKTGTLTQTDGGASSLVGIMRSEKEDLYFVCFGSKGSVSAMRTKHDATIRSLQQERGGPCAFEYPTCRNLESQQEDKPSARKVVFKEMLKGILMPECRADEIDNHESGDDEI